MLDLSHRPPPASFSCCALLHVGPTVASKAEAINPKGRRSIVISVVVVIDERGCRDAADSIGEDALAARAHDVTVRTEQDRATAYSEVETTAIDIGTLWARRTANDDAVRARRAATHINRREIVVVLRAIEYIGVDERAFLACPARRDDGVSQRAGRG